MKTLLTCFALLLSVSAMSAEIADCQIDGVTVKNVVVPSALSVESIQKVLDSDKADSLKKDIIKSLLFVESAFNWRWRQSL